MQQTTFTEDVAVLAGYERGKPHAITTSSRGNTVCYDSYPELSMTSTEGKTFVGESVNGVACCTTGGIREGLLYSNHYTSSRENY